MTRPDWNLYFIRIAKEVASRSTCPRAAVGVVITINNRILATGYNGAPAGKPHCDDIGCEVVDDHCVRALHAEANAVAQATEKCIPLDNARLYCWDSKGRYYSNLTQLEEQCRYCYKVVRASGITEVLSRGL